MFGSGQWGNSAASIGTDLKVMEVTDPVNGTVHHPGKPLVRRT